MARSPVTVIIRTDVSAATECTSARGLNFMMACRLSLPVPREDMEAFCTAVSVAADIFDEWNDCNGCADAVKASAAAAIHVIAFCIIVNV